MSKETLPIGLQIVAEARQWIDTPWRHAGREKGVGVDCVGLLIGVARDLGLHNYDNRNYSRIVSPALLRSELLQFLQPVSDRQPGDVLIVPIRGSYQHVIIWTGEGAVIDANERIGRVTEHRPFPEWRGTIASGEGLRWAL